MSLPLIFGVIIDGTKEYKRLIAGTKLGCIWQALHQERREDSNDCNAPTARLEMTDKVLGSHLGPVSYAYPIYIPSCPRLGNKALDDKKDFKLQPKRIILGLKWHRWHWHFWVSTGILPRRWRPMLPLSTRGVSGPWHWNHGGMVQVELRELSRRAGTSSAS